MSICRMVLYRHYYYIYRGGNKNVQKRSKNVKSKRQERQFSFYDVSLDKLVPESHVLRALSDLIDWTSIEKNWDELFEAADGSAGTGRPATRPRLVASLMLLQDLFGYSDKSLLAHWRDTPVFQYFSGEIKFTPKEPIDPTTLVKWRQRVAKNGANDLLKLTLETALKAGAVKKASLKKVIIDTTVMEKNITHPKDFALREKGRKALVRNARKDGLLIVRTYVRQGRKLYNSARCISPNDKQKKEKYEKIINAQDEIIDKLIRDIRNKAKKIQDFKISEKLQGTIDTVERLCFPDRCENEKKPCSIHEPDVRFIRKGNGPQNLYIGNKVSVTTTHKEGLVVEIEALEGNPHDGRTLRGAIDRTFQNTKVRVKEATADRGYLGHGVTDVIVNMSTKKQNISNKLRKTLNRRTLVEAVIGHMKNEGRLRICPLQGIEGSKFHAILCGCAQNLRLIMNHLDNELSKVKPHPPPNVPKHA